MSAVQGKLVLLELSEDDGATYLALACLLGQGWQGTRQVNTKSTQCGTNVGLGPVDGKIPWSADLETEPAAPVGGIGQCSLTKLMEWFLAGTRLKVRQQYPVDGSVFFREGFYYITEYNEDDPVDNVITATGNLQLDGTLNTVAPEP
jgi:hypothetical protein